MDSTTINRPASQPRYLLTRPLSTSLETVAVSDDTSPAAVPDTTNTEPLDNMATATTDATTEESLFDPSWVNSTTANQPTPLPAIPATAPDRQYGHSYS